MGYRAALLNFSKGEISPELEARFDLPAYQAALRVAKNVTIQRTGGVRKRPGTRYVAACLASGGRLIPFQFSDDQAYALEFTQAKLRPLALGGAVLETGLQVTAITKDAAGAVVTAAYHGYALGDPIFFKSIPGMTEINDRFLQVIEVIDVNTFRVNIDSSNFTAFVATDVGQVNGAPPPPPSAPPTVPPPITTPTPPPVGSGSGGGYTDSGGGVLVWKPPRSGTEYQ